MEKVKNEFPPIGCQNEKTLADLWNLGKDIQKACRNDYGSSYRKTQR